MMVHRVNADFMDALQDRLPQAGDGAGMSARLLRIMKNRDLGIVDEIIKLYFDAQPTMSDVSGLPPQHAWTERIEQMTMSGFTEVDDTDLPEDGDERMHGTTNEEWQIFKEAYQFFSDHCLPPANQDEWCRDWWMSAAKDVGALDAKWKIARDAARFGNTNISSPKQKRKPR